MCEAVFDQEGIATVVVNAALFGFVTVTIHLYADARCEPGEVGDVGADGGFTPEAGAAWLEVPQDVPHDLLGPGAFPAEAFGADSCEGRDVGVGHGSGGPVEAAVG